MGSRSLLIADNRRMRFLLLSPFIGISFFILACALASPYFERNLMIVPYKLVTSFVGKICHQYPSRSFYLFDSNVGLCTRCFGLYLSLFLALIAFVFIELTLPTKVILLVACCMCLPMLVDGSTQYWGLRESNNLLRLLTGFAAGIGISTLVVQFYFRVITGVVTRCFHSKTS